MQGAVGTPGQQGIAGARGPRVSVETFTVYLGILIPGSTGLMGGKSFFAMPPSYKQPFKTI